MKVPAEGTTFFRFLKKTVTPVHLGWCTTLIPKGSDTTLNIHEVYYLAQQVSVDFWDTTLAVKQKTGHSG